MPRLPHAKGANSEISKNSGGGGVNSSDLVDNFWRNPQNFVKKFFFNKNHNFWKIFAEILLKSQRGDQRKHFWETFLNLVQKFYLGPPFKIFSEIFFPGGATPPQHPPLGNPDFKECFCFWSIDFLRWQLS
jgi:hypothetical protein